MKKEFAQELIEKAKSAKSAAELIAIAKENGVDITNEEATDYFAKLNPQSGDIADDELKCVAGGGCHNGDGRLIVTALYTCDYWSCVHCGQPLSTHVECNDYYSSKVTGYRCTATGPEFDGTCGHCGYCSKAGAYVVCNHPAHHS